MKSLFKLSNFSPTYLLERIQPAKRTNRTRQSQRFTLLRSKAVLKGRRWPDLMAGYSSTFPDMLAIDLDSSDNSCLILRARAGEEAAFGELIALHERAVLRTAWRLVGNVEDARDIAQEAFLRLHRHLRRIEADRDLAPWLYRVTVNLGLSALRRRKRKPETSLETGLGNGGELTSRPEQIRRSDAADARRLLVSVLDQLSAKERAAIVLRDLEGLDIREVARVLRCRRGTVRTHLSRGRLKLRTAIEARGGTP